MNEVTINRASFDNMTYDKVTRVEVIDEKGRAYVNWNKNNLVTVQFQDNGRTLKIFIDKKGSVDE